MPSIRYVFSTGAPPFAVPHPVLVSVSLWSLETHPRTVKVPGIPSQAGCRRGAGIGRCPVGWADGRDPALSPRCPPTGPTPARPALNGWREGVGRSTAYLDRGHGLISADDSE